MSKDKLAKVYHAELWGLREQKYDWLRDHDLQGTQWRELAPKSEFYLFIPRDEAAFQSYERYCSVTEVFPLYGVGMTTARDEFVSNKDKQPLINRIRSFRHDKGSDDDLHRLFNIAKKKGWSIRKAWEMLQNLSDSELAEFVVPMLYRPFDVGWIFYHDSVVWRTVKRVMRHMLAGENVALVTPRRVEHVGSWQHAFVCTQITEHVVVSLKTIDYHFPLYLYPSADREDLFAKHQPSERQANLNPKLVGALAQAYGREPSPEEIFHYVYAVLYAPVYRQKYAQFLRMDFPRIPFTADAEVFRAMAGLGARLAALHLLKSPELDPPAARFEGEGDNRVAKSKSQGFRYDAQAQRMYINKTQWFAPVALEVWEYQIGGYQVCQKWLKDRKERRLGLDEIRTYCRIVTTLSRTISIQEEIDVLYPRIEQTAFPGRAWERETARNKQG